MRNTRSERYGETVFGIFECRFLWERDNPCWIASAPAAAECASPFFVHCVAAGGSAASAPAAAAAPAAADNFAQAMAALTGLGYTPAEARDALQKVGNKEAPADELLRLALRSMAGF